MNIFSSINTWLFAPILRFFMGITGGNYAMSIFIFTLTLNIILIPLSVKSQKAAVGQFKIKPKLDELKKKYGDDKQKYNMAMQQLYRDNNVSMGGGCLPMILRLVLVMSVYYLVTSPITYLSGVNPDTVNNAADAMGLSGTYRELYLIPQLSEASPIYEAIKGFDFHFLGLNLTKIPDFTLNFSNSDVDFKLWIIPFLSFAAAMFSSILSIVHQKRTNPDAPGMTGMMLIMPLFSLWIAFGAPAGLGFYWACSSLIGALIQLFVNKFFSPAKLVAKEQAGFIIKRATEEQKYVAGKRSAKSAK